MRQLTTTTGILIAFYDSIEELTADRHRMLQQADLEANGVGWTKEQHLQRLNTTRQWIKRRDLQSAMTELDNAVASYYALVNGVDLDSQAVACLLATIDDKPVTDVNIEGLALTLKPHLPYLNHGELSTLCDVVKKNYMPI